MSYVFKVEEISMTGFSLITWKNTKGEHRSIQVETDVAQLWAVAGNTPKVDASCQNCGHAAEHQHGDGEEARYFCDMCSHIVETAEMLEKDGISARGVYKLLRNIQEEAGLM